MKVNKEVIITNIYWKRTYLYVEYNSRSKARLVLKCCLDNNPLTVVKNINLNNVSLGKDKYCSKINIVIADKRDMLSEGKWFLSTEDDDFKVILDKNILLNLENYSRVFRYSNDCAYVITFFVSNSNPVSLFLHISYMMRDKNYKKVTVRKILNSSVKNKKSVISLIYKKYLNFFYQLCVRFPRFSKKSILFFSQNLDCIRGNMEALSRRIYERKLDGLYKIKFEISNIFDKKTRFFYWMKIVWKIARSDYIFVDDYVPVFSFLNVNSKNVIVQLWHAGFGFKLVGYGRFGITGSPHPYESCHRKYTYGIVGNDNLKEIYSEVWGIDEASILSTGMPRLDNFLNREYMNDIIKRFFSIYPTLSGKRIITFAPTYRGFSQNDAYYDYEKIDLEKIYNMCLDTNSVFLLKFHHFITNKISVDEKYLDCIYDLSDFNLNELLYVTDILVTDYSSCFYDFLLLNRPIIFYVYDKDIYEATRGIHRKLEDIAPGKICLNFDELLDCLRYNSFEDKKTNSLLIDKCLVNKKCSCDQIIDYIILKDDDSQ